MKKKKIYLKKKLYEDGYCVVENFLSKLYCDQLIKNIEKIYSKKIKNKFDIEEGSNEGQIAIRDLVLRDPKTFLKIIDKNLIMKVLDEVFNDKFILENIMASNSINVKNKYSRTVHIDSHLPCVHPKHTSDVVVLFCLDDFTKYNGATKVWPKSHLSGKRIHHETRFLKNKINNFKYIEAKRGSIVFFLGQTWHMIGRNVNSKRRWGILNHYKRWWIKPSTDFTKCGSKIFKLLNRKQRQLFGFTSIPPRFNLKSQIKNLKTLRKFSKLPKDYLKVIQY